MAAPLRAGLIGTGSISQSAHVPAWCAIDEVEVVALADPDPAARPAAVQCLADHGRDDVATFDDHGSMLGAVDLDFVDVTIPAGETKDAAMHDALDAGCHVTCQKPFVRDLEAARRLAEHAAARDRILSVNQQARYAGAFDRVHGLIEADDLGDLRTVRLATDMPFADEDRWLRFSVHNFDLLRHWLGREPTRVNAWHERQSEDDRWVYATWLDFDAAPMVQVWDELSSATALRWSFRVGGSAGTVRGHEAYLPEMLPPEVVYTPAGETTQEVTTITDDYVPDAFERYFERFVAGLRGDGPAPTTAADNVHSLRIAFAARRSAEDGGWVALDEVGP